MRKILARFTYGGGVAIAYGLCATLSHAATPPIVRPTGSPQRPLCFVEMPNQAMQDLDSLCGMGKPKPLAGIDLVTDRDKDGVPDELAAEFRKMDDLMDRRANSPAERMAMMRQAMQAMQAMSERLPYAPATQSAIREGVKLFLDEGFGTAPPRSRSNPGNYERFDQLNRQMQQDPVYQQVEQYRNRFMELKFKQR
jgi:hypothetical protein